MDRMQAFNDSCIKSVDQWGQTVFYNICNGDSYVVPWGLVNYVVFPMLVLFLACCAHFIYRLNVEGGSDA